MKVKKSHVVIESWMLEELKLKGIEKDIYAVIYGFSKDKQGFFTGSLAYLQFWTQSTKMGVYKALKNLISKGYIVKTTIGYNRVAYQALDCEDIKALKTRNNGKSDSDLMVNSVYHDGKLSYTSMVNSVGHDGKLSYTRTNNIDINKINTIDRLATKGCLSEKKSNIPTLEEVKAYAQEVGLKIDPVKFYELNKDRNWITKKGEPVKRWKSLMLHWDENEIIEKPAPKIDKNSFMMQNTYDYEQLEKDYVRN